MHVIEWWKREGRIEHRPEDKMWPTLRRSSVEEFGRWYRARQVELDAARRLRVADIERRQTQRAEPGWLTHAQAALIIGCDPSTVNRYVRAGPIASRRLHAKPSLDREFVEAFAERWRRRH